MPHRFSPHVKWPTMKSYVGMFVAYCDTQCARLPPLSTAIAFDIQKFLSIRPLLTLWLGFVNGTNYHRQSKKQGYLVIICHGIIYEVVVPKIMTGSVSNMCATMLC